MTEDGKMQTDDFSQDFHMVAAGLRELCTKYNLPLPRLVFTPQWRASIGGMPDGYHYLNSRQIYGIQFNIGFTETCLAIKEV